MAADVKVVGVVEDVCYAALDNYRGTFTGFDPVFIYAYMPVCQVVVELDKKRTTNVLTDAPTVSRLLGQFERELK